MPIHRNLEERFWEKVNKTGSTQPHMTTNCWEWIACLNDGYGYIIVSRRCELAHRVVWRLVCGPIPDGLFVCHHCDNRRCVRPDHLFLGTNQENMHDRYYKMRGPGWQPKPPPAAPKKLLTPQQVAELRADYATGVPTMRELGTTYNITAAAVCRIVHGQTYRV